MSNLKKDIAKLKICHFCAGIGYCEHKKQVVHDIFNLIESVIPKEKTITPSTHSTVRSQLKIMKKQCFEGGYNACISDIKNKLIDGEKK